MCVNVYINKLNDHAHKVNKYINKCIIMEELLQDIFKEASGPKLAVLRKSCQDALGN